MKMFKLAFITVLLSSIVSCSSESFEGKYEAAGGTQEFNFSSNGYVTQHLMGEQVAKYEFKKNGNEIKIYMNEETPVLFTLRDNSEIIGPGGVVMAPISTNVEAPDKYSSKVSEADPADKPSRNIAGRNYVSKPDPDFKPEYASTIKLFFESDEKVKLSFRYYDTGAFRENENMLSYEIDGDIITLTMENGELVILTVREDGSLFNDVDKTEFVKLN